MNPRYNPDPRCNQCEYCKDNVYPNRAVCYETEEYPNRAVTVKAEQKACRMFRGRRDDD